MGHAFFLEDAVESKNEFRFNLGISIWASLALLNSDQTPSVYWITNPDNSFIGNVAVGSAAYGFWLAPEAAVSGASAGLAYAADVCPQGTPLGAFRDNVAHSNAHYGLRIHEVLTAREQPCSAPSNSNPYVSTQLRSLLSYRNAINGVQLSAVAKLEMVSFELVDNLLRGIEMPGAQALLCQSLTHSSQSFFPHSFSPVLAGGALARSMGYQPTAGLPHRWLYGGI